MTEKEDRDRRHTLTIRGEVDAVAEHLGMTADEVKELIAKRAASLRLTPRPAVDGAEAIERLIAEGLVARTRRTET